MILENKATGVRYTSASPAGPRRSVVPQIMNRLQRKANTVEMNKPMTVARRRRARPPSAAFATPYRRLGGARRCRRSGSRRERLGGLPAVAGAAQRAPHVRQAARRAAPARSSRRARYSRTPSFAWAPVRGATHYEFELSTSDRFRADNGLVWSSKNAADALRPRFRSRCRGSPAIPRRCTGVSAPSAAARSRRGASRQPFSMRWSSVPSEWRPAADRRPTCRVTSAGTLSTGATGYQVWFVNAAQGRGSLDDHERGRRARVLHVARRVRLEVEWRVRAVRRVYGKTPNSSRSSLRPVEPGVHVDGHVRPTRRRRTDRPAGDGRLRSRLHAGPSRRAQPDAGVPLRGQRRPRTCTGCTSSVTATASTPSHQARSSAAPRTRRAPADRSTSLKLEA